ncbi:MAG: acetyl-CoA carboxylase biotin carboxyl carrier protein subunit [Deltaproteobacteria bacterium]|nr:MAG: acetyl-CoA carboxylase biotin carboxyl carrier protein subunit [Deltaproteobacteria bacterium]RLA99723.1 MAG: acetyl-CoA carboxylase biotin carboxyl carrier protein subunit [Deltaproteobacteria bacterium]
MDVTVPMVGKVTKVLVKVGDQVKENDQVATIEAMKMEMPVVAPISGTVREINVKPGDEVTSDTVLMVIE